MKSKFLVISMSVVFLVGCKNSSNSNSGQPAKPTGDVHDAKEAAPAPTKTCAKGEPPQVFRGVCSGAWQLSKAAPINCEYVWGPAIKCPTGTKAIASEAACYGTTYKPVTAGADIHSAADCAKAFGQQPQLDKYDIQCCPI